jgi:hypothetical protein
VTSLLQEENELSALVTGGWAVGSYTYFRRNARSSRRRLLSSFGS